MGNLASLSLILAAITAIIIGFDLRRNPQKVPVMNIVWIFSALWGGLLTLIAYLLFGRNKSEKSTEEAMVKMVSGSDKSIEDICNSGDITNMNDMCSINTDRPKSSNTASFSKVQSTILSTLHCGTGCLIANLIGEIVIIFIPITIFGSLIFGTWGVEYILAILFGLLFKYITIRSLHRAHNEDLLIKAIKFNILSITFWQIGVYGCMALYIYAMRGIDNIDCWSSEYWYMMQVAMLVGFLVALPISIIKLRAFR